MAANSTHTDRPNLFYCSLYDFVKVLHAVICFVAIVYSMYTIITVKDTLEEKDKTIAEQARTIELLNIKIDVLQKTKKGKSVSLISDEAPGIYHKHLKRIVSRTLIYLGVENVDDWSRLIMLTIAVESDMGRYTRQVKGPARGITQSEPESEQDCLRWTRDNNPSLWDKVMSLRTEGKLSGLHESEYNLAYSIAICYLEYYNRKVNPKGKTTKQLAQLHKKYYNTYLGKATVENSLKKIKKYKLEI